MYFLVFLNNIFQLSFFGFVTIAFINFWILYGNKEWDFTQEIPEIVIIVCQIALIVISVLMYYFIEKLEKRYHEENRKEIEVPLSNWKSYRFLKKTPRKHLIFSVILFVVNVTTIYIQSPPLLGFWLSMSIFGPWVASAIFVPLFIPKFIHVYWCLINDHVKFEKFLGGLIETIVDKPEKQEQNKTDKEEYKTE